MILDSFICDVWQVMDSIAGETITFESYMEAFEEAERRIAMHEQEFPYKHKGYHFATPCKTIENKSTKTISIIKRKD